MVSSRSSGGWRARSMYRDKPYAVFAFVSDPVVQRSQPPLPSEQDAAFVVRFLRRCLESESEVDLSSEASFLQLVFRREPSELDELKVCKHGPIAEFGFGLYPAAPESWPVLTLRQLMAAAISALSTPDLS